MFISFNGYLLETYHLIIIIVIRVHLFYFDSKKLSVCFHANAAVVVAANKNN